MKKIFVTVAEFWQNGGELKTGRLLFEESIYSKKIEPAGEFMFVDDEGYIVYRKADNQQSEDGDEYLFVEIACTSHYI